MGAAVEWLKGKKSYLTAIGGGVVIVLWKFGVIDSQTAEWILGSLGFAGLAFLRAGMDKK